MHPDGSGDMRSHFVALALDAWKISRLLDRVLDRIDAEEARKYVNQLRFTLKSIDGTLAAAGYRLVMLDGQPYDEGMAVTPLNAGDFGAEEALVIEQTIEPIVMGAEGVVRAGAVLLAKGAP